jgi:hypothetical protein
VKDDIKPYGCCFFECSFNACTTLAYLSIFESIEVLVCPVGVIKARLEADKDGLPTNIAGD